MTQVLACFVVAKNVIAGITIRKVDVPIEPHGNRRWIELLEIQSRLFRILEPQNHLAGRCVEFDPLSVGIAGPINELAIALVANLHVVQTCVVSPKVTVDDFAIRGKYINPLVRTGVDVSCLIDHHRSVSRANGRFAVGSKTPTRNGLESHQSSPHTHRLDGRRGGFLTRDGSKHGGCDQQCKGKQRGFHQGSRQRGKM